MKKNKEKRLEKASQNVINKSNKKNTKQKKQSEQGVSLTTKIVAGFFLILMLSGVVGFALSQNPAAMSQIGQSGTQTDLQDFPVQRFEEQGQVFWAAVKNGVIFQFDDPQTYEGNEDLQSLIPEIENLETTTSLYIDPQVSDDNAVFLLEEYLHALEIQHNRIDEMDCSNQNIILTTPENEPEGDCITITAEPGNEAERVEALLYYLLE